MTSSISETAAEPNHAPSALEFERVDFVLLTGFGAVGKWPAGATAETLAQNRFLVAASLLE